MTIDLTAENLITLSEAARLLPTKPAPCTLWRWRSKGVNGARLECVRSGGRWLTTRHALVRFLIAQTQATSSNVQPAIQHPDMRSQLREAGLLPRE